MVTGLFLKYKIKIIYKCGEVSIVYENLLEEISFERGYIWKKKNIGLVTCLPLLNLKQNRVNLCEPIGLDGRMSDLWSSQHRFDPGQWQSRNHVSYIYVCTYIRMCVNLQLTFIQKYIECQHDHHIEVFIDKI